MSERKPVIYVAGPFRAATEYKRRGHIAAAEQLALEVWRLGGVALCPHLNTAHFDGELLDEVWIEGDLVLLSLCQALVLVPGWELSEGARAERERAVDLGMPVFYGEKVVDGQMEQVRIGGFSEWLASFGKQQLNVRIAPRHRHGEERKGT